MNIFTGDKPKTLPFSHISVPKTSHKYNRASPRPETISPGGTHNQSRLGQTQQIFPRPQRDNQINPFMYRNKEDPQVVKVSPVKVYAGDNADEKMTTDYDIEIMVPLDEYDQVLSEEQLSTIMKIGLKSLQKFEKKDKVDQLTTASQKRRKVISNHP